MKLLLIEAAIALFVLLAVMALFFRSAWARDVLRFAKRMLWVYVALVLALAVVQVVRQGGL